MTVRGSAEAEQFVPAGAPEKRAKFDAVVARDQAGAFRVATIVWGCGLVAMSAAHVALAVHLPHDEFVLISPTSGVLADLVLLGWSARYTLRRLAPYLHGAA